MPALLADARAELTALCERGLEWRVDASRALADPARVRRAAVLVLFGVLDSVPSHASGPIARDLDVLLLRRAATLVSHPGQIAFPGGGIEASDLDAIGAALREAVEETGLDVAGVEPLGVLPDLAVPVSNHLVTPVCAWWARPSGVAAIDHDETVEVFRVPVADLLDSGNRMSTEHLVGGHRFRAPAFAVAGRLVWGFTAIVLARMFDELGWTVPWDHTRIVEPW